MPTPLLCFFLKELKKPAELSAGFMSRRLLIKLGTRGDAETGRKGTLRAGVHAFIGTGCVVEF